MIQVPRAALSLGLAGLIPFLWGAWISLGTELDEPDRYPLFLPSDGIGVLAAYGTVIFLFMCGALWGLASRGEGRHRDVGLAISVVPALWAFFALFPGVFSPAGPDGRLASLAGGFVFLIAADWLFWKLGLAPAWWMRLRVVLTTVVVACLAVGLYA